jgi:hypothetical protein
VDSRASFRSEVRFGGALTGRVVTGDGAAKACVCVFSHGPGRLVLVVVVLVCRVTVNGQLKSSGLPNCHLKSFGVTKWPNPNGLQWSMQSHF